MTDKMKRFLTSIKIYNIEDFDMDFDYVMKDRFEADKWQMQITKDTPWRYDLLKEFQDALINITYSYNLRFLYRQIITSKDVASLFFDWFQTSYHFPPEYDLEEEDNILYIVLNLLDVTEEKDEDTLNNELEATLRDFHDFLNFIGYEVEVKSKVIRPEETKNISKRKMNQITKAATESAEESIENDEGESADLHYSQTLKEIEEQHREEAVIVEDKLLQQMKENAEIMRKERERARLNRRGNYTPIDLIDTLDASSGNVDLECKVFSIEIREFGGVKRINVGVHDRAMGAIYVNARENASINNEVISNLKRGTNVRVRGVCYVDEYTNALTIRGHYIDLLPADDPRPDTSPEKRVELHLHSLMSVQDGVGTMDSYCKLAKAMGHKAIAITDHGVVQGYPEAQEAAKKHKIKMLYGSELYMVDDQPIYVYNPCKTRLNSAKYVVFDLETTGLSTYYDRIIEFGAVRVEKGLVTSSIDILINPGRKLPEKITKITNITDEMLKDAPSIEEVMPRILDFIGDAILVSHNAQFDFGYLQEALKRMELPLLKNGVIDTLPLSRYLFPESRSHRLGSLCRNMGVFYDEDAAHRADYDANVLNDVWQPMLVALTKNNIDLRHEELMNLVTPNELLKHIRPNHIVCLARDKQGLKDLYKLVSLGHVEYLAEVPKVPRHEIEKLRGHLLLGSACFNGDVFRTARYYNFERLKQVISFYDYIEIQPPENYSFLIHMGELDSEEQLLTYLKDIVRAAKESGVMVCATGDCHYVNPEDKVFRDVYISAKAVGNVSHPLNPYDRQNGKVPQFDNPDQHFRSTDEMLEAMKFLGDEDLIKEIVITNTNKVADMIESLVPLPNDKLYTPTIENCEENLTNMVYSKAKELYGDPLPEYIKTRLEAELNGIINNGFSVIYYIAHLLIKKAHEDGYIVGSRGSVGSSLVATMANITEVNPLPPHYRCPRCKHFEWTKDTYPDASSGYDLPDRMCPECGEKMVHDGQNIPFETFLGFHAEKTPDIDLNFPPDYQARAHDYTKVLLGENNVFRAGTIETVAEKTAFGFARGYIERLGYDLNTYPKAKIAYLASGCIDVKRTTGQHPGGIVVIPREYEVYDFTPVQYPADDKEASWKTTHFDFHSIHDTILKLDLLGHVDPMALKMMSDLTGIDIHDIPMNDKNVLSLFSSPKALKMKKNYLNQQTGAMAIPEFGTDFVRGILEATKPQTFSDLVIISGLSHGTDVWNGNAEKLIQNKTATLKEVIGCRDDIMTYLISKGIPSNIAFAIMEDVRKGRGLKEEYVEIMKANNVPDYYIASCNLIKYMFPKGHAVAYVTMAIRVGYFKIYYPLEFYATFFSVRSKQHDIATMIKGEMAIVDRLDELKMKEKARGEVLSPKEEEIVKTLQIAVEMVQRGYTFGNIDLYKSDATNFVVDHENNCLIPPFTTIDGLGESAALSVVEARKDGPFYSKEELLKRTKLNGTNVKVLDELGVLKGLSERDQLSLFDF